MTSLTEAAEVEETEARATLYASMIRMPVFRLGRYQADSSVNSCYKEDTDVSRNAGMMADYIIDQALSDASFAVIEAPPAFIRSVNYDVERKADDLLAQLQSRVDKGKRELEELAKKFDKSRSDISYAFKQGGVNLRHLVYLLGLAGAIERKVNREMEETIPPQRRIKKTFVEFGKMLPYSRGPLKKILSQIEQQSELEFNEYLDFALFLRALHAEYSPDQEGPIFDSPQNLKKYLESLVA